MLEHLVIFGIVSGLPWHPFFMLMALAVTRVFQVHYIAGGVASSKIRMFGGNVRKTLWAASAYDEEGSPLGFIVGRFYVGYTSLAIARGNMVSTWLVCPRWVDPPSRVLESPSASTSKCSSVMSWARLGDASSGMNYIRQSLLCPREPTAEQNGIVDQIASMARRSCENGFGYNVAVWLHGPPGSGKSQIGGLLAKKLDGAVCINHCPMDPGDELNILFLRSNPSESKPLVLVLNEWDCVVRSAFTEPGAYRYDNVVPEVWNKVSYCNYMDRLSQYDNTIVIITSNSTVDEVRAIDAAAARPGRIDLEILVKEVAQVDALRARRFE